MAGYPTPPPTSSPKSRSNRSAGRKLPAQETYFQESYNPPVESQLPAQDGYFQPEPTLPAQETYSHSYSTPASPNAPHWDPSSKPLSINTNINPTSTVHFSAIPPRRNSSPVQYPQQPDQSFPRPSSAGVSPTTFPPSFPPKRKYTPPRPLYSSPLNPTPTPYSTSRPAPRPGLLNRIARKIEAWIKSFARWSSKNPITAGLLTFIPVFGTAVAVRLGKGIGKLFAGEKGALGKAGLRAAEKGTKKEWGYGLDHFVGFAGAKERDGPLAGVLKILHMLVNHYCKLSPSFIPRLASIFLELYFLDVGKTKL